jgi:hypothetical protein
MRSTHINKDTDARPSAVFLSIRTRAVCITLASLIPYSVALSQSTTEEPLSNLKRLTRDVALIRAGYTFADAQRVGVELVRSLNVDSSTSSSLADYLASEQLAWQSRSVHGIDEAKLVKSMNSTLQLENAPEWLRIRQQNLRRIRVFLWAQLREDLDGGIRENNTATGDSVLPPVMSPFEAYAAGSLLVFQKLHSDEFLRTEAEDEAIRANPTARQVLSPGLHALEPSSRVIQFNSHLKQIVDGFAGRQSLVQVVQNALEGGRQ